MRILFFTAAASAAIFSEVAATKLQEVAPVTETEQMLKMYLSELGSEDSMLAPAYNLAEQDSAPAKPPAEKKPAAKPPAKAPAKAPTKAPAKAPAKKAEAPAKKAAEAPA